ncbi:MAG: alpha-galactosidase, partial [Candidatus Poribacteria bacterium]
KVNRPIISVSYENELDTVRVDGIARFNGMELSPKESIDTDMLILQSSDNPFTLLESYTDLIAEIEPPRKTKATTGWCSWYAIRMPISHDFTMANAHVVADRLKDLGMDIMLLDHGWQTGDICGDWDEDINDYPKGLEGLAKDLGDLGLKLGIWIAPTEVAQTSKLFTEHPDRVLKDKDGKPQETWKWYWAPNPSQYQMDATNPDAYKYIVETFRRLTEKGSAYYKIDFIAGCSGENLFPIDPKAVRGWTPLQKAMQAIREGAGEDAYIRYCQTPPLLSNGLADGVYATNDTLDAGASTWNILREVFRMSSAEYYLQGLYIHEACDLSIRAHAGTEECRLRVMMLALSGSSIMFSDDLTKLPEERIVMMQQTMPPFPKPARPINLFTATMPDIWHLHCSAKGIEWDLLALYNFDENQKQVSVSMKDLGLAEGEYIIREFWTEEFIGIKSGSVDFLVPGLGARLYSFWRLLDRPQYVGTNLHLSQGEAELANISWDKESKRLSGTFSRAKGIIGKAYFNIPSEWKVKSSSYPIMRQNGGLWAMELLFEDAELSWEIVFC